MPIEIREESNDGFVAVHVTGKLVKADYESCIPQFEKLIRQHSKLRLLFELSDFHGWEGGALWDEIKLDMKHFADIERIAVIGDKSWEQDMVMFYRPFTKAKIRYFESNKAGDARKWLLDAARPVAVTA